MASESTHLVNIKSGDMSAIGGVEKVNASIRQTQSDTTKANQTSAKLSDTLAELGRQRSLDNAAKAAAKYTVETGNARTAQLKLNAALEKTNATQSEINRAARVYHNEMGNITREMERQEESAKRVRETVGKYGGKFGREQLGDVSTSLSSLGSVTGAFGTNAPTEALRLGGDTFGVLEYSGRFKQSLKEAGEAITQSSGLFGTLAQSAQKAIPGLSAASAGLLAIGIVAVPIAAIAAAVAVFANNLDQARQAAEKQATAEKDRARQLAEQALLLKDGDFSGAEKAAEDARKEVNLLSAEKEAVLKLRDEAQKRYDQLLAQGDTGGAAYWRTQIDAFNTDIDTLSLTLTESSETTAHLEAALSGVEGQAAKAAEELQKQIAIDVEVAKKRLAEETKLTAEYEKSIATIAALKQQQDDLNKSYREASAAVLARRQLEDRRAQEDRDKTARRAQEDLDRALQSAEKAHKDNLLAIQQRGNDAILAARADLAKKEAETVTRIADLQAQFREDQAKAEAEYFKQRKRDTEDYHRDRRRAEQDFAQSQLEGLINNDITSLVLDQGAFDLEQKRARQDRRRDRRRGREDFEGDRAEAEAALAQKIADIQAELVEYQNATAAKILAIQTQTENDLLLAQAAYDERLRLDAEERQIKSDRDAEDLRIANERRTQDRQAEDMARLVSHHAAIAQIQEKAMLEQSIADGLKVKLLEVQELLKSTSAYVLNVGRGLNPDGTVIGGGGQYTGAGGSQINNPKTNAPIGPSNVTPFSPQFTGGQNTRGRGGDGGGNMSVQITPQVVEIGGMQFVPFSVFEESINAVVAGIGRARNQRAG